MAVDRMAFSAVVGTTVLSVVTVQSGPVTVIDVAGDLDMDTVNLLGRHVDRVVTADQPVLLILDLGRLGFLGAAGITALLACNDCVSCGGGWLRLRRLPPLARLSLRATHTIDLFDIDAGPVGR